GSRRSYYLLPILPAAAILVARLFAKSIDQLRSTARWLLKLGFAVIALEVAVWSLALLPPRLFMPNPYALLPNAPDRGMLAICWIGAALALWWAFRRMTSTSIVSATATVAWLFMFYFFVFAMPAGDAWRGEKQFAYRTRDLIGSDTGALAFYRVGGPVYYLALPIPVPTYESRRALYRSIRAGATRWVVVRQRDLDSLDSAAAVVAREAVFPWDSKGHRLNAMVLVRVGAASP
ncbi:MAG: hypothetical protein ACREQD_07155, partial [Candidatus Binataceae bacterium]